MNRAGDRERHQGYYAGTEINGKWWKRYKKAGFFARGNGEYWIDDTGFCFRRTLTRHAFCIPFAQVVDIRLGRSHAGRWIPKGQMVKIIWRAGGRTLSSGFVLSRSKRETATIIAQLRLRSGLS